MIMMMTFYPNDGVESVIAQIKNVLLTDTVID